MTAIAAATSVTNAANPAVVVAAIVLIAGVVVAVLVAGARAGRRRRAAGPPAIDTRNFGVVAPADVPDEVRAGWFVQMMRVMDPAFDPDRFLARASAAFLKIQAARSAQETTGVRAFVSDAVHERMTLEFDEQRALGYRRRLGDVTIRGARLAHCTADGLFDHLEVRFDATAVDQRVVLGDETRVLAGGDAPVPMSEIWTFLRRQGVLTDPSGKPGLMEGACPNCAGPVELNQSANCQHCGAVLRSGRFDWVLTEVTGPGEWRQRSPFMAPGVLPLRYRDPQFNNQQLEDKAAVVFWRKLAADRAASVAPLRKAALSEFAEAYDADLRARRDRADHAWFGEPAVESIDVLGVLRGSADGLPPRGLAADAARSPYDRALAEVRWHAARFARAANATIRRAGDAAPQPPLLLILARRAGVASVLDHATASAHCPNCGAPETGVGNSVVCDACGQTLNDAATSWALADVLPTADPRAAALLAELDKLPKTEQELSDFMNAWFGQHESS